MTGNNYLHLDRNKQSIAQKSPGVPQSSDAQALVGKPERESLEEQEQCRDVWCG